MYDKLQICVICVQICEISSGRFVGSIHPWANVWRRWHSGDIHHTQGIAIYVSSMYTNICDFRHKKAGYKASAGGSGGFCYNILSPHDSPRIRGARRRLRNQLIFFQLGHFSSPPKKEKTKDIYLYRRQFQLFDFWGALMVSNMALGTHVDVTGYQQMLQPNLILEKRSYFKTYAPTHPPPTSPGISD